MEDTTLSHESNDCSNNGKQSNKRSLESVTKESCKETNNKRMINSLTMFISNAEKEGMHIKQENVDSLLCILRGWRVSKIETIESNEPLKKKLKNEKDCIDNDEPVRKKLKTCSNYDIKLLRNILLELGNRCISLFEWQDGPLIESMEKGGFFLLDEISLAEDSVLERLNAVFETERILTVAEKPINEDTIMNKKGIATIEAKESFRIFATMNPGGDFGKKELSPALRNRMTEIWLPAVDFSSKDTEQLILQKLGNKLSNIIGISLLKCIRWFNNIAQYPLSMRDVLAWMDFIISCCNNETNTDQIKSNNVDQMKINEENNLMKISDREIIKFYIHGGLLIILDGLGLGNDLQYINDKSLDNDSNTKEL